MILDIIQLIFKELNKKKFSSFLTLFAISLGILSVFVIVLLGSGFEKSIEDEFTKLGTNRLYVSSESSGFGSNSKTFSDNEVNLLKSKSYVDEVYKYYIKTAQIEYSREFISKSIFGMDFSQKAFEDLTIEIEEGRYPKNNEENVVVIGPLAATELFDKELNVGSNIYIRDNKFKVIGITKEVGNSEDDKNIYVNINDLHSIYETEELTFLYVIVNENEEIEITKENVETLLENKLGKDTVEITTPAQFLDQLTSILDIVKFTLGGIAFVAIIVGALGIINTMYVIVTEKTKDIGIMKSIGATNNTILFMYMTQAGFFGLFGAILGIILGSFGVILFEKIAQGAGFSFLKITIDFVTIISLLIFGFLIGILAGYLPSRKASKLTIVETLRK